MKLGQARVLFAQAGAARIALWLCGPRSADVVIITGRWLRPSARVARRHNPPPIRLLFRQRAPNAAGGDDHRLFRRLDPRLKRKSVPDRMSSPWTKLAPPATRSTATAHCPTSPSPRPTGQERLRVPRFLPRAAGQLDGAIRRTLDHRPQRRRGRSLFRSPQAFRHSRPGCHLGKHCNPAHVHRRIAKAHRPARICHQPERRRHRAHDL